MAREEGRSMNLNPTYSTGRSGCTISLTTICHGKGMEAYHRHQTREAYLEAYYATLRRLMPEHLVLADTDPTEEPSSCLPPT